MPALYVEQLEEGQVFEHPWTRTVTETDDILFFSMTMNPAKLRIDAAYGTTVANLGRDEVRLPKPVFQGGTLRVRSEMLNKRASKSRPGQDSR